MFLDPGPDTGPVWACPDWAGSTLAWTGPGPRDGRVMKEFPAVSKLLLDLRVDLEIRTDA